MTEIGDASVVEAGYDGVHIVWKTSLVEGEKTCDGAYTKRFRDKTVNCRGHWRSSSKEELELRCTWTVAHGDSSCKLYAADKTLLEVKCQ